MNKQKLGHIFILSLLFVLGLIYGAQVFVNQDKAVISTVMTDVDDDNAEKSEEKVNESSSYLFLQERPVHYLKPISTSTANLAAYISKMLPEACITLATPPPDFTIS